MEKIKIQKNPVVPPEGQNLLVLDGEGGWYVIAADDATLRLIAEAIKAHFGEAERTAAVDTTLLDNETMRAIVDASIRTPPQVVSATGCTYCGSTYYAGMPGLCQCQEEAENG